MTRVSLLLAALSLPVLAACAAPGDSAKAPSISVPSQPVQVRAEPWVRASEAPVSGVIHNRPAWQYWGFSGGGAR